MSTKEYRVIVAGGRNFDDYNLLSATLDTAFGFVPKEDIALISGTARGADSLGEQWATERGIEVLRFPANWDTYGKSAGYRRNEEMAKAGNYLIAFWDGQSRGTQHMIGIAARGGLHVTVVPYRGKV